MPGLNELVARTLERKFSDMKLRFSAIEDGETEAAGLVAVSLTGTPDEETIQKVRTRLMNIVGSHSQVPDQPIFIVSQPDIVLTGKIKADGKTVREVFGDYESAQKGVQKMKKTPGIDGRTVVLNADWSEALNAQDEADFVGEAPIPQGGEGKPEKSVQAPKAGAKQGTPVKVPASTPKTKKEKVKVGRVIPGVEREFLGKKVHVVDGKWIKFQEAADIMGVRYQQVFQRSQAGKMEVTHISEKWYASLDSVKDWYDHRLAWLNRANKQVTGDSRLDIPADPEAVIRPSQKPEAVEIHLGKGTIEDPLFNIEPEEDEDQPEAIEVEETEIETTREDGLPEDKAEAQTPEEAAQAPTE